MSVVSESLAALEDPELARKVLISPQLMDVIANMRASSEPGTEVSVSWGEPDTEGFYTPTMSMRHLALLP